MSCSDGNCFFRDRSKPFGQVTNGRCHCLDDVNPEMRIELRRFKQAILSENATLRLNLAEQTFLHNLDHSLADKWQDKNEVLKKQLEVAVGVLEKIKESILDWHIIAYRADEALAEIKRIGGGE